MMDAGCSYEYGEETAVGVKQWVVDGGQKNLAVKN
jgi:hypothetical protein